MDSTERVRRTILGQPVDRQPIYGWLSANLTEELTAACGSVAAFEDQYEFDVSHVFGGPGAFDERVFERLRAENDEMIPDLLLDEDFFTDPDRLDDYRNVRVAMAFHKRRGRFCYVQTPGFFEQFNDAKTRYPEVIRDLLLGQVVDIVIPGNLCHQIFFI